MGPAGPAGTVTGFGTSTGAAAAGLGTTDCVIGEIYLTAGAVIGHGVAANGQIMAIQQNTALFSMLGTTYGGDGKTTFALPDMRSVTPNNMTYSICIQGIFPGRA
jgi:microcystin-dependent protein